MDIERLSQLSRVKINAEERRKFTKDLAEILDYIGALKKAPVENLAPLSHAADLENAWREDKAEGKRDTELLIPAAPRREKGYIKVKPIFPII